MLRDQTILITDSLIAAVAPATSLRPPAGAQVIDGRGKFVIPRLIDAHVHLATEPDGEDSRPRAEQRLDAALHGGVTTARDMAGDTRALAPATGATAIKLSALLDSTTAACAIVEAHAQGLRVWAHAALRPATPGQLAGAGVNALSHASLLAQALLVTQAGFTPGDAIVAATRNSALAIGLTDRGVVAKGRRADLVLLRADPTVDIRNTRQIELVIKRGVLTRRPG